MRQLGVNVPIPLANGADAYVNECCTITHLIIPISLHILYLLNFKHMLNTLNELIHNSEYTEKTSTYNYTKIPVFPYLATLKIVL